MTSSASGPSGLVVVDKPEGPTSHDVVSRARRALGTRKVGHAGTLDPLASGVLVVLVGEATKLGPYVTAHAKRYTARVVFGLATDTLDREGQETARAEPPPWLRDELAALAAGGPAPRLTAALAAERARTAQTPPTYSAIKVGGKTSYARARAGEAVELADRSVELKRIDARGADSTAELPWLDVDLVVSKGYYVRSLARDLGLQLSLPSHLGALRRTESGPFALDRAIALADLRVDALIPLADAARLGLPAASLSAEATLKARQGKRLEPADFVDLPPLNEPSAWLDPAGELVAVGTRRDDAFELHRGFGRIDSPGAAPDDDAPSTPEETP
jgi:tRNA pseudouridine55 synthase